MVHEADEHAEEDRAQRDKIEAKNEADSLIYSTEKSLNDYGDKISDSDRDNIAAAVEDLKKALETDVLDEIKGKSEALKQASYKLAEEVYKNAGADAQSAQEEAPEQEAADAGNGDGNGTGSESTENVEDVDYEVVDDDEDKK